MRSALFVLLFTACTLAGAQRGVLVSPLPDNLDNKQILEIARQVLTARGWTLAASDGNTIAASKDLSSLRVFVDEKALRFRDPSQGRGMRQRNREEVLQSAAVPQQELDALRADLVDAFAGKLPLASSEPPRIRGQVLLGGISPDLEAAKVMDATRAAFIGRRWEVTNAADGAIVAHIRGADADSTLNVFLADGALRFTDRTIDRKGGRSQVPERWLNNIRKDLDPRLASLAPSRDRRPAAPDASAAKGRDPAERLRTLKALLDAGAITQAEYDAKRAEIIKGL